MAPARRRGNTGVVSHLTYHNRVFPPPGSHVLWLNHHTSRMAIIVKQFETRVADDRRGSDDSRNVWDLYPPFSSRQALTGGQVGSLFARSDVANEGSATTALETPGAWSAEDVEKGAARPLCVCPIPSGSFALPSHHIRLLSKHIDRVYDGPVRKRVFPKSSSANSTVPPCRSVAESFSLGVLPQKAWTVFPRVSFLFVWIEF